MDAPTQLVIRVKQFHLFQQRFFINSSADFQVPRRQLKKSTVVVEVAANKCLLDQNSRFWSRINPLWILKIQRIRDIKFKSISLETIRTYTTDYKSNRVFENSLVVQKRGFESCYCCMEKVRFTTKNFVFSIVFYFYQNKNRLHIILLQYHFKYLLNLDCRMRYQFLIYNNQCSHFFFTASFDINDHIPRVECKLQHDCFYHM